MVAGMRAFGFGKKALEFRLEMNGRVLCEGTTKDLPPETTIGRAADCTWRIPPTDKTASNHHARLFTKRGKWVVEDTGSRNGLYCKGQRVSQWTFSAGDQVSIGDCVLVARPAEEQDAKRAEHHRLEQLNGADAGRMVDLERETSVIGSAVTCDVVCDDNLVSHRHAEVTCKRDGSCWVKDLKSRNGTRVNRVALKANERMLRDGDILSVAYVDFRFWDKNTTHVPSNVRLRAVVAVMTVLVCMTGWFFWNAAHPSAEHLLKLALREGGRGHFAEAGQLAVAARLARHHVSYAPEIQERNLAIRNWQETAMAWEDIQDNLGGRRWVSAQKAYSRIAKWDWNTDSATLHQRRAECVKRLLDAFLEMRKALESTYAGREKMASVRAAWEAALRDAEREPAMQEAVWPLAFNAMVPGEGEEMVLHETDTEYENVWHPLREAGRAISAEIATGLAVEKAMREELAQLIPPPGTDGRDKTAVRNILAGRASACREKLQTLHEADQAHKRAQQADQQERKYMVLRYCSLPEAEYSRVRPALDELAAAERIVVSNLETVASMETDWEKRLQPELAFPSHIDDMALRDYQSALSSANAAVCGRKQRELKNIHFRAFLRMGLAEPSGTPHSVARLMRPGMVQEILRFIDWTKPPVMWGSEVPIQGCAYDECLGSYYTYMFLSSAPEDAKEYLDRTPTMLEEDHQFCPVARRAREDYSELALFVEAVNADPLLQDAATRTMPLSGNRPNRLKQYYDRARKLLAERDAWLEETVEPRCGQEDREGVAARALYLVVSPHWDVKMHSEANRIRGELVRTHIAGALEEAGQVGYLETCVPDSTYFTEWREYHAERSRTEEWP